MRVTNGILLTMEGERFETGYVDFENGIITACGATQDAPAYDGETFDAAGGFILPGLIDAHTHIGISEEGLRWEGEDCNETTSPVTPDVRAVDGFNPFDTAIPKARQAGIKDIRQKGGDVLFVLNNLNFEAVGSLCADPDYKTRVTFLASAKEPTLRLKLASGVDSLKQSKVFIDRYRGCCNS